MLRDVPIDTNHSSSEDAWIVSNTQQCTQRSVLHLVCTSSESSTWRKLQSNQNLIFFFFTVDLQLFRILNTIFKWLQNRWSMVRTNCREFKANELPKRFIGNAHSNLILSRCTSLISYAYDYFHCRSTISPHQISITFSWCVLVAFFSQNSLFRIYLKSTLHQISKTTHEWRTTTVR